MKSGMKIALILCFFTLTGCTGFWNGYDAGLSYNQDCCKRTSCIPAYRYYNNGCCDYGYYNNEDYNKGCCDQEGCYNCGCRESMWR